MKIRKLGIEWGAAYEEAQPIRITHMGREVEIFVDNNHDLRIRPIGCSAAVTVAEGALEMRVWD